MFKIESYITPLLMGYIDKYVRLKHEDFQLSLWGGDVVLNKLDLRLDAIEEMLNLPITFKSGHIYELRIHVPWTKLGSEPVVITINTIECILKLRESGGDNSDAGSTSTASTRHNTSQAVRPKMKRQDTDDLPPGYLQSLISKVINNVNIVINNLILKFVEDDIVLSANVKSAECYSVNHDWLRAFTELSMPELVLRKVINFHDLTVCLDKRNADGKIETYQDPFLYRCSLTCRMHMIYDSLNSKMPTITKFNLLCEELNLSLTDTQVPMFFRLMELCIAIYYGSLELPGDPGSEPQGTEHAPHPTQGLLSQDPFDPYNDVGQESWGSWAWSYVPQILPTYDEDEEYGAAHCKQEPPILCIGFYVSKASITFKLSKLAADASFGPSKMTFKPCMTWHADGISLEMLLRGLYFFNAQFGICSTHIVCQGDALCGGQDIEGTSRDPMFLRSTLSSSDHIPDGFKTNSLFDPGGAENQSEKPLYTFDHTAHLGLFTESYALRRYGTLWLDYIYTMEEPPAVARQGGSERSAGSQGPQDELKEDSTLRFIVGPLQLILSSSSFQRLQKFYQCMNNHDYEPYMKPPPEPVDDTKGPPTEVEVKAIQEFIAKRSYQVTFIQPTVWLKAADLPLVEASKANIKRKKKGKSKPATVECHKMETLPMLVFHMERFDMTISSPMYPYKIARVVSKMTAAPENLLQQSHSHTYFKVTSGLVGLSRMEADGSVDAIQNIIQPWNATIYDKKLLHPVFWHNLMQPRHSRRVDLSGATLTASNPQLLLVVHILLSWTRSQPQPTRLSQLSLLKEVFEDLDSEGRPLHAVLQCSLLGIKGMYCSSPAAWSLQIIAETVLSQMLQAGEEDIPQVTPLLHSQVDTSRIPNQWFFQQPLESDTQPMRGHAIVVTAQVPANAETPSAPTAVLVQVKGLVGCLDMVLCDWLSYVPRVSQLANQMAAGSVALKGIVDPALADSTSPLKNKQTSQGSQTGSNQTTAPTESHTQTLSRTQSRSVLHKQVSVADHDVTKKSEEVISDEDTPWGRRLAKFFPVIKIMQVQVDIEHTSLFFPRRHIKFPEPRGMSNIPHTLHNMFTRHVLPETLVVSFPKVKLHSVGHRPVNALQDLPIRALSQSVAGEKLPWTVEISGASVYTIHQSSQLHYLAEPASVSATVAVTTKYTPPMSDHITSLGLVIHADLDTVVVASSQRQMQLLYDLGQRGLGITEQLLSSYQILMETMATPDATANQAQDMPPSQPLLTSPALPARPSNHNMSTSSQWETPDPVVTITATSEDLSRETTPVRELESGSEVKLSLWLQWTLPKFLMKLYGEQAYTGTAMCLIGELEDLNSSVDVQDVYAKVKCRVGAFNVKHLEKNVARGMWQSGALGGILLTCDDRLSHNVQVAANRVWSPQGMPKSTSLFGDNKPRDKTHGFLNFTYTRALRKNVKKRLRKLQGDHDEVEKKDRGMEMTDHGVVYLNEVCLNVHPCDMVVNCPVLCDALSVFAIDTGPSKPTSTLTTSTESVSRSSLPFLVSNILPLLYITTANLRMFVPVCRTSLAPNPCTEVDATIMPHKKDRDNKDGTQPAHRGPDMCLIQLSALSISPQADNPLPRIVLEKTLYRQAVHMGMTQQAGAEIEDRQYQLDIASLGMATGYWQDFLQSSPTAGLKSAEISVQNPALEWNNLSKTQEQYGVVPLIPIASKFDLRVVAAPAITYTPSPTFPDYKQPLVVCGYSLEVNATSDMDFFLSTSQVQLGLDILHTNLAALQRMAAYGEVSALHGDVSFDDLAADEMGVTDSGVESEFSVFITPEEEDAVNDTAESEPNSAVKWADVTPFEVLLTAGKISCMVYSYAETEGLMQSTSKQSQGPKAKSGKCKTDLDWKGETQSLATLSSVDSGLESMVGSVAKEAACGGSYQHHIVPFLYAHFSQPHTLLNCHQGSQRAELSCYDIVLKGAKPGYVMMDEGRWIPELSDFPIHWVETRPGQPSPKTGIPPSLYTLAVTDFLSHPAQVRVKFERPLKLNCSPNKLEQTLAFWSQLDPVFAGLAGDPKTSHPSVTQSKNGSSKAGEGPPEVLKSLVCLDSVHVSMVQLVVAMEMTSDLSEQLGAQVSFTQMDGVMDMRVGEKGWVDNITGTLDINDLMVKTAYAGVWQPLVGPVTFSLTLSSHWQPSSGPAHLPIMHCSVDAGVLQCYLGQEHVMAATGMAAQLASYVQVSKSQDVSCAKSSVESVEKVRRKSSHLKPPVTGHEIKFTEDDLRAGDFQYIAEEVDQDYIPQMGQICFSQDPLDGTAIMAWSYAQPRIISHLAVTPVPLSVPAIDVRFMEEYIKVSCILQYWDPLTKEFISYCDFQISENDTCTASLPELSVENVNEIVAAMTWRILILHPEKHAILETDDSDSIKLEPLISPLTLAASLRVDSTFDPRFVHMARCSLKCELLEVYFVNHLTHFGKATPQKLVPFTLAEMPVSSHEYMILSLDRPRVVLETLDGHFKRLSVKASSFVECQVLEYGSLTMQPLLEPVHLQLQGAWIHHDMYPRIESHLVADHLQLRVGASTIHTLSGAAQLWAQVSSPDPAADQIPMHYYLLCNDTQECLHVRQAGTEENLVLRSRECLPYSWRSQRVKPVLILSLDSAGHTWCEPFQLDTDGSTVRFIEGKGQRSTLIIRIKQVTGVQKQVTVSGQIGVASLLSQHLEVKMLSHTHGESLCVLGARQRLPSYVVEQEQVRAIRVRLMGIETPWSQEVVICGEKMKQTRLLKIPLYDKTGYIHVWCHIFLRNYNAAQHHLLVFAPLFVVRSQLPAPLLVNVETPRLRSSQQVQVTGQGQEEQLHLVAGDMSHTITFQLSSVMQTSSPAISLSSGMIEQVKRRAALDADIDDMGSLWMEETSIHWPYNQLKSDRSPESRRTDLPSPSHEVAMGTTNTEPPLSADFVGMEQPNIDLQVALTQWWSGCNTLLIDVAPYWMIVNDTQLDFMILESNDRQWNLTKMQTFAPPQFDGTFQLGIIDGGLVHLSDHISLSEEDHTYHCHGDLEGVLCRMGHIKVLIPIRRGGVVAQVCYLVMHSTMKDNLRVITVRDRYVLSCHSHDALLVQGHAVPLSMNKVRFDNSQSFASQCSELVALSLWNISKDISPDALGSLHANSVLYVTFKQGQGFQGEGQNTSEQCQDNRWSVPVRVRISPGGSRCNVVVPPGGPTDSPAQQLVLTCHESCGVTYLVLREEIYPLIEIHNNCAYPLQFGQSLVDVNVEDVTIQEEAELSEEIPLVAAQGTAYYAFPACNNTFPESISLDNFPKLHLAGYRVNNEPVIHWSHGIDIAAEHDSFVSIPNLSDVKVHIEKVCYTTHVFIDPVSRADVSAREIRSRIKGKETTVVVEGKPEVKAVSPPKDLVIKKEGRKTQVYGTCLTKVSVLCKQCSLVVVEENLSRGEVAELLRVTTDSLVTIVEPNLEHTLDHLSRYQPHAKYRLAMGIGSIQVDNQMYVKGFHDFPVILLPQQTPTLAPSCGSIEQLKQQSVIAVDVGLTLDLVRHLWTVESLDVSFKPLTMYVEDVFIYDILKQIDHFIPSSLSIPEKSPRRRELPLDVRCASLALSNPIRLQCLTIQPTAVMLSVHASLKLFIASDNTPLKFGKFERKAVFTSSSSLIKGLAMHYASGALFRAGLVVGSLEILGNPTGLIRSIGTGVADLFRMPYHGLTQGPGAFIGGVTRGMTSLLRHISTGTLTSITNFASSVSRNMDRLSLDSDHCERQEESRRHKPAGLSQGLFQGLTGFGLSLLGAVAGLADQPLQSLQWAVDTNVATSPTRKATGIVSGVGKGLVGAFTKPIGGAAELVSQTGLGLLQGVGLTSFPKPRNHAPVVAMVSAPNSAQKYLEKYLHSMPNAEVVMSLPAVRVDSRGHLESMGLVLTPEVLFLINVKDDHQVQALAVLELTTRGSEDDPCMLNLLIKESESQESTWDGQPEINNKDRVAAFIDGSGGAGLPRRNSLAPPDRSSHAKQLDFQVDPRLGRLFLALIKQARAKASGSGFPV